jgi:pyridine nucleotide-disulfide oxidoreductase family protein
MYGCIPSKRLVTDSINAPKGDFKVKEEYYNNVIEEKKKLTGALRKANYDKLIEAGVEIILRRSIFCR